MMKILNIGESPEAVERCHKGLIPSHWFYGAMEMEKDGHEVIWRKEESSLLYDIKLILETHPDIIFIPNLNVRNHLLLLILATLHIIRIPIYAYLHHSPKGDGSLKSKLYKWILPSVRHLFFLSEKSMQETIDRGFVYADMCSYPEWGADRKFYELALEGSNGSNGLNGECFVSTGKENRDFDILIEAFKRTGAPLKILTAKSHAGSDYTDLEEKCKDIPNIEVVLTENSSIVFPMMLEAMAKAKALVCPLRQDRLTYCVGLSTIADAEGLHKPLIITRNPYHSPDRMKKFNVVETLDDWVAAIKEIEQRSIEPSEAFEPSVGHYDPSIQQAYENMKSRMNLR